MRGGGSEAVTQLAVQGVLPLSHLTDNKTEAQRSKREDPGHKEPELEPQQGRGRAAALSTTTTPATLLSQPRGHP